MKDGLFESNGVDKPGYLVFEIPFRKCLLNSMKNTKW